MCPLPPDDPFASPWKYDGTWQARLLLAVGKITGGSMDLSTIESLLTSIDGKDFATETTLAQIESLITSLEAKIPTLALQGDALKVHVANQIDLTTITGYLLDIKTSVAAIDTNTDGIEGLIQDTVDAINNGATSINGNLANIITELQGIDANTDGIEAELTNILNKIIAAPATELKQDDIITAINNLSLTSTSDATKQNQYNQIDLLTLMYEEMQEQTRILKKIYQ